MKEYHKIQTVYKRDPETKHKTLLEGEFSIPEFEYLRNNEWIWTEKVDGTNLRVMYNGTSISFGGKTDNAQIPNQLVNNLNSHFLPKIYLFKETFGEDYNISVCFYLEGYGAKIQKGGGNYRSDQWFVLFDIRIGDWWLNREVVEGLAIKFELDTVPIIGKGTLYDMIEKTRQGFKSQWGDFIAEGIVARPSVELFSRKGDRIITKIKHKDFPK